MSGTARDPGGQTFLSERLWPGVTLALAAAWADRLAEATDELRCAGRRVTYLRGWLIPGDETMFLWFDAPSASGVPEIGEHAGVRFDRISLVIDLPHPATNPSGLEDEEQ
jgi:hypothetical protein